MRLKNKVAIAPPSSPEGLPARNQFKTKFTILEFKPIYVSLYSFCYLISKINQDAFKK